MSSGIGALLKAYWQSKHRDGALPDRSDVDPAEIRGMLPSVVIVEAVGGDFRFRLVGTAAVRQLGCDPTGRAFAETSRKGRLEALRRVLQEAADKRDAVETRLDYFGRSSTFESIDAMVLPLRRGGDDVRMLMVSMEFNVSADASFAPQARSG